MNRGIVHISENFFSESLKLPIGWFVVDVKFDPTKRVLEVTFDGSDFPEIPDAEASKPPLCRVTVHKENIRFEVERVKE